MNINRYPRLDKCIHVVGIDPGTMESAYVIYDIDTERLVDHGYLNNQDMEFSLEVWGGDVRKILAIEMVGHYGKGMSVGKTVFVTCVWIGRFLSIWGRPAEVVLRKTAVANVCGTVTAKNANVSRALKDRFGEVPTSKNPNLFFPKQEKKGRYTFNGHQWQALAIAVTVADNMKGK